MHMKRNKNVTTHSINVIYFSILSQIKFVVILIAVISTNLSYKQVWFGWTYCCIDLVIRIDPPACVGSKQSWLLSH